VQVEIEANPNCQASEQFMFNELDSPRMIRGIRMEDGGKEYYCAVVGVDPGGKWVPAYAAKITDSGAGFAYIIVGGAWGIRLKPEMHVKEEWDLSNEHQWGEPFKIYGDENDIFYDGG
jgi:hypothetical protein